MPEKSGSWTSFDWADAMAQGIWGFSIEGVLLAWRFLNDHQGSLPCKLHGSALPRELMPPRTPNTALNYMNCLQDVACFFFFLPPKVHEPETEENPVKKSQHVFVVIIRGWSDHYIKRILCTTTRYPGGAQLTGWITTLIHSATRTFSEPPPSAGHFGAFIQSSISPRPPPSHFTLKRQRRLFCTFKITFLSICFQTFKNSPQEYCNWPVDSSERVFKKKNHCL